MVETSIQLVLVLVLSIYMLLYGPRIGALVRSVMPPGDGTPQDDFPTRVQKAVSGYVRGQLLFSRRWARAPALALWIFGRLGIFADGRRYALAFGVFFGVMELVPFIGPILGALPPLIVAFFEDPLTAVWVGLLFLALQQLEGHVVAPQVFSLHAAHQPAAGDLRAAVRRARSTGSSARSSRCRSPRSLRETVLYLRRHLVLEPWGTATLALAGRRARPPPSRRARGREPTTKSRKCAIASERCRRGMIARRQSSPSATASATRCAR